MAVAAQLVDVILSPSHHLLETSKIRDQMKCFTRSLDCERVHLVFFWFHKYELCNFKPEVPKFPLKQALLLLR